MKSLNKDMAIHTVIVAVIFEMLSLPFLGLNGYFAIGMAIGTVVTILNFTLLVSMAFKTIEGESPGLGVVGFLIRMIVYAITFAICVKFNSTMAIAAAIGFVTQKVALVYVFGIKQR